MTEMGASFSPERKLLELMRGYRQPLAMYLAVQLGLAELLAEGAKSAEGLAAASGSHALSLLDSVISTSNVGIVVARPI